MKQASRIQRQMEQAQEDLSDRTVDASSGGGAVKITAKCDGTLKTITIDPESVDKEDISLEDLVLTAANKALEEAKEISNDEMGKLTSGLKIPGLV